MVVLAASVLTKPGKVVLSRQFVTMTRGRIETLLANFPKLIATDSTQKQHTFVETEDVRYVYQPIEQLYLVLVTTKQSNIMEDLETLRLLSQLILEYCGGNTEALVREKGFELCFAFDEAVSMGYQENVTLTQVKTFIEMDSHEERLSDIIKKGKENEARVEMQRKAEIISRQKEQMRKGSAGGPPGQSYSVDDPSEVDDSTKPKEKDKEKKKKEKKKKEKKKQDVTSSSSSGMQLGGKPKGSNEFYQALSREENLTAAPAKAPTAAAIMGEPEEETQSFDTAVAVSCLEKLVVEMDKEGGVKSLSLAGELKITVFDPEWAKIRLKTSGALGKEFKTRLHPKVSPKEYKKSGTLQLSDPERAFPTGSDNAPVILRWVMKTEDESQLPFTVNFWANPEDDNTSVDVTLELQKEHLVLKNIVVTIPCNTSDAPEVAEHDGEWNFDARKKLMVWRIPELSEASSKASLDFTCDVEPDDFYPLSINFESSTTYSQLQVESIEKVADGTEMEEVNQKSQLAVTKFEVSGEE
eukprot:g34202.t1